MTKLAPEWVRTSDPVIRSPARYRWTTVPAQSPYVVGEDITNIAMRRELFPPEQTIVSDINNNTIAVGEGEFAPALAPLANISNFQDTNNNTMVGAMCRRRRPINMPELDTNPPQFIEDDDDNNSDHHVDSDSTAILDIGDDDDSEDDSTLPIIASLLGFDFIECFTTTFLRAHSWLNWVEHHCWDI